MLALPGRVKQGEDSAKACKAVARPGISQINGLCLAVWPARGEENGQLCPSSSLQNSWELFPVCVLLLVQSVPLVDAISCSLLPLWKPVT